MADNVRLRLLSYGNKQWYLTAVVSLDDASEFRLVAKRHPPGDPTAPQTWTRTSRGGGRHTFHQGAAGNERYLTAEGTTNRSRVVMAAKRDGFDKQTWRDNPIHHLELGTSQRWLQADSSIDCGQRLVVEVVTQDSLGQTSEWEQIVNP